jgi:hypothetical protein
MVSTGRATGREKAHPNRLAIAARSYKIANACFKRALSTNEGQIVAALSRKSAAPVGGGRGKTSGEA